ARLGLENCDALGRQVREAARLAGYESCYDVVLFRAVGSPANFVRQSRRLLAPNGRGLIAFYKTPEQMAAQLEPFVKSGYLNILGGCCGTRPTHIRKIAELAAAFQPRQLRQEAAAELS
ncbi:MAG: homocysteine S-methyltransferase family protein, partial [Cyclobacteriaceae bacterium]